MRFFGKRLINGIKLLKLLFSEFISRNKYLITVYLKELSCRPTLAIWFWRYFSSGWLLYRHSVVGCLLL
jgi:hypothetical protein